MIAAWSWSDVLPAGSFADQRPPKKVRKPRKDRGRGRHRSPLRAEAVLLVRDGMTYTQVANVLGISRSQVAGYVYREEQGK